MPRIISFGWTWPAIRARVKTVTRRAWSYEYASMFRHGDICQAYDKVPFHSGRRIGLIRLTRPPYWEPIQYMPDSDYVAEGFQYLHAHPGLLPASMPIGVSRAGFREWRASKALYRVVRFEHLPECVACALPGCHADGAKGPHPECSAARYLRRPR
jgi:hypothetical protein